LKKWNVPSVIAEGDIVDLKMFDYADTMRKCVVLEEMMDQNKKIRKERGLEW